MPRTSTSNKKLVAKYLCEFPAELFRSEGDILYCTACDKRVSCSQRSQVTQHIATGSHIENKNRKKERTSYQAFLTSPSSRRNKASTQRSRYLYLMEATKQNVVEAMAVMMKKKMKEAALFLKLNIGKR
ncbi:uncharacterized protein [Rhodnius prolixus]|uniref:uncharacterized protein n=1 Tax=Rhodnius prolixus TaxID=13249 RepID=UPI003D18FA4B